MLASATGPNTPRVPNLRIGRGGQQCRAGRRGGGKPLTLSSRKSGNMFLLRSGQKRESLHTWQRECAATLLQRQHTAPFTHVPFVGFISWKIDHRSRVIWAMQEANVSSPNRSKLSHWKHHTAVCCVTVCVYHGCGICILEFELLKCNVQYRFSMQKEKHVMQWWLGELPARDKRGHRGVGVTDGM